MSQAMQITQRITPFLSFPAGADDTAKFYVSAASAPESM